MAASVEPHSLATDLSQAVTRFRRAMQRSARANFDPEALSPTEVELLLLVAEHPGIGVAAAASELGAAPNTVSTLIRKLVTLGLLHREFSRGDRRVARLLLTEEASGRLERWRGRRADVLTDALAQLDADQQRLLQEALPLLDLLSMSLYQPRRRARSRSTTAVPGDEEDDIAVPHDTTNGTGNGHGTGSNLESVQAEGAGWALSSSQRTPSPRIPGTSSGLPRSAG
ncbi:MAG: MarR family winged helix-turn-helix transcriptional regulator [Acidimicrobiales bacterium]